MIRRRVPLRRSAIVRRPPKRRPGFDDPDYRAWLKSWPCWICFNEYCRENGFEPAKERRRPEARRLFTVLQAFTCGVTEVAHVGGRGFGQRCKDREAMPLGTKHHMHPTAGGGPESHHGLGKKFWGHHQMERESIFAELHELYFEETGRAA